MPMVGVYDAIGRGATPDDALFVIRTPEDGTPFVVILSRPDRNTPWKDATKTTIPRSAFVGAAKTIEGNLL